MSPGSGSASVLELLTQQKTSTNPFFNRLLSKLIIETKQVICIKKLMLNAPAAYRAKARTAGMSDKAPRKNEVA
jgi:hypothetical protein